MKSDRSSHVVRRVTVYAAASRAVHDDYVRAARDLGTVLGRAGLEVVYGGGSAGLMGHMADAALDAGGRVHGIIPEFLQSVERGHDRLTSLEVVPDMRARKARMLENSDAVVALPGGSGTLEELFEAVTLKRLGQFLGPIVLVNTGGYYDGLTAFLEQIVEQRFMNRAHLEMWQTVDSPAAVPDALADTTPWSADALEFAAVSADDR